MNDLEVGDIVWCRGTKIGGENTLLEVTRVPSGLEGIGVREVLTGVAGVRARSMVELVTGLHGHDTLGSLNLLAGLEGASGPVVVVYAKTRGGGVVIQAITGGIAKSLVLSSEGAKHARAVGVALASGLESEQRLEVELTFFTLPADFHDAEE